MSFGIYKLYALLQPGFRQQRLRFFIDQFQPTAATQILDVGGLVYDWRDVPIASEITVLNIVPPGDTHDYPSRIKSQIGDGRELPFPDQSFDIVYSNSAIEHLNTYEDQRRFAKEALRVGKRVFVQTPNRWFPIEPHFVGLFFHYFPKKVQRPLIRFLTLRGLFRSGDNIELKALFDELRLLSSREMRQIFPGCVIHRERLFGLTKSLIALKRSN